MATKTKIMLSWHTLGLITASWLLLLFFWSSLADFFLLYQPSFPYAESRLATSGLPRWFYSFANFDGVHYLTIAEKGYEGTGLIQAFFPLYPTAVGLFSMILPSPILAGLLLSAIGTWVLLYFWQKILLAHFTLSRMQLFWACILLLSLPTSFFFAALYTESWFMVFVLGSFAFATEKKWQKAGLFALLASATRVVGIFLVPALLFELWWQNGRPRSVVTFRRFFAKHWTAMLWSLLGCLGLVAYMAYLWITFKDPVYFFHVQAEFGGGRQETIVLYPQVVWRYLKILFTFRPIDLRYWAYFQEAVVGVLGMILLFFSARTAKPSIVLFSFLAFMLPTLTGTFSSMPRYVLVSCSIWLLCVAMLKDKSNLRWAAVAVLASVQLLNSLLFIQGYWLA